MDGSPHQRDGASGKGLEPTDVIVSADQECSLILDILSAVGVPAGEASTQAKHLVEGDLRGFHSHGLQRLPVIVARIKGGLTAPVASIKARWASSSFLAVDGGRGLGPVVAYQAIAKIARRARETGITVGAITNSNHVGMLAPFVEHVARSGQVCIAMTTSEALVHPFGGSRALLGTNPLAIGIPTASDPFVLDMATGEVSMGKILSYLHRGEPIPPGWALDADGRPTTDASAAAKGAISPFGGAKGYGLGIAIELLVGVLAGSALGQDVHGTLDTTEVCNKGDVFICVEATRLRLPRVTEHLSAFLNEVRQSGQPGHQVLVPGDRSRRLRAMRLRDGIPIQRGVWSTIQEISADLAREGV